MNHCFFPKIDSKIELRMNILILQKNTGIAGAQNSLRRLLLTDTFKKHKVVVVTGLDGWFVEQTEKLGIPVISVDFPSSRSVYGKLAGNHLWLKFVIKTLNDMDFVPEVLQANNHVEAPFLKLLKNEYRQALSVVFLRDGYLQESTFNKYQCYECDLKVTVSKTMLDVLRWDSSVFLINNGIFEHEIYSMPCQKSSVPARWLVLGNPNAGKGWFDFFSALSRLVKLGLVDDVETIVLTGIPTGEDLELYDVVCNGFIGKIDIEFVSPFEDLGLACKNFDLIISPSRNESFGMAVLEACCSRECVVSSRTGIADKIIFDSRMLFFPGNVDELVESLKYVIEKWPNVLGLRDQDLDHVRGCFNVERNAKSLLKLFRDKQNSLKCND